ncbi:hypothetical protein [Streptomyces lunalinharesii]|uniref:Uncharacterized protein n=1 Tax=Streptomyces lunalinharesii TaxID=333384 RepID=A0ABP6FKX6_9ACTN
MQQSWVLAPLGPDVDGAVLDRRCLRLGSVRAVAVEVLGEGEQRARLLADPLRITVDGVVTVDLQENLKGIERQIQQVTAAPAPDAPDDEGETEMALRTATMVPERRYR